MLAQQQQSSLPAPGSLSVAYWYTYKAECQQMMGLSCCVVRVVMWQLNQAAAAVLTDLQLLLLAEQLHLLCIQLVHLLLQGADFTT
jgi:hypothetical protein